MFRILTILKAYFQTKYIHKFSSRNQLEKYQQKRLKKHLRWISAHSKFYRGKTKWQDYPVMNKQIMMTNLNQLNTKGIDKEIAMQIALKSEESRNFSESLPQGVTVGLSSGTSGNRGLFLADQTESARWAGIILAKLLPQSLFARHRIALFLRANSNLYETLNAKRIQFKFFDLITPVSESAIELANFRPSILVAPPSLLRLLAIMQNNRQINLAPKRIYSAAEVLDPLDEMFIQDAFQQKVLQIYQCTEGFLGHSCEYGTIHLNEDFLIIEKKFINKEQTKFHPLITDLERRTQPIIRYEMNDILTLQSEQCPCGSLHLGISQIEGRADDIFYFENKQGIHQEIFPDFIRRQIISASDKILQYKVIQPSPKRLLIYLNDVQENQQAVQLNLNQFFDRISISPPKYEFHEYTFQQSLKKMKRIERGFKIENIPDY